MRTIVLILMMTALVVAVAGSVWAGTSTSGMSGVVVQQSVVGSQYWYSFTVYNLTDRAFPTWDALVGDFLIAGAALPADPVAWVAPTGWSWNGQGWQNDDILYNNGTGTPYIAPPSVAPGGVLPGFVLKFNQVVPNPLTAFSYQTHLFGVDPIANPTTPQTYDPMTITEASVGLKNAQTWWDAPLTSDDPVAPPWNNNPIVPELSSVLLGAMGMLGPVGYAIARKRSK